MGAGGEAGRVRLGANSTTPAEILLALALDSSVMVRTALVLNPSAPAVAFGVLSHDPDERVRTPLAAMLSLAADVPLAVVERAATLRSTKGVVSLVWKAGFTAFGSAAMPAGVWGRARS
jgi:hypothetical protein